VKADRLTVDALELEFTPAAAAFSTEVDVEASDDLQRWRQVATGAPVALLRQGAETLTRRRIDLAAGPATYLRVRARDEQLAAAVATVTVRRRTAGHVAQPRWTDATFVRREPGAFVYRLPARVLVEQVEIRPRAENAVARFVVESREEASAPWQAQGELTAFRLKGAGLELSNDPLALSFTRDREWRLVSQALPPEPPRLRVAWAPERWLVLTRGPAPYALVAGSSSARREAFSLEALVAQVRARYGAEWQPPAVTLGLQEVSGGERARTPAAPERSLTYALWGVLVLGAAAVIFMVLRLLRGSGE